MCAALEATQGSGWVCAGDRLELLVQVYDQQWVWAEDSRLASCTHTASGIWAGFGCGSWTLVGVWGQTGKGSSSCISKCEYLWHKNWCHLQEMPGFLQDFYLTDGEICWVCLLSRFLWTAMTSTVWLLLVAPAFLLVPHISIHLNFVSLGRVKSKEDICTPKAGEACCSDFSSSPGEGNSFYLGDALTTLNVASLGDVVIFF